MFQCLSPFINFLNRLSKTVARAAFTALRRVKISSPDINQQFGSPFSPSLPPATSASFSGWNPASSWPNHRPRPDWRRTGKRSDLKPSPSQSGHVQVKPGVPLRSLEKSSVSALSRTDDRFHQSFWERRDWTSGLRLPARSGLTGELK